MSQPVKLSDGLVLDARLTGEALQRSIAGQVEFWARLGRAVEQLLRTPEVIALSRTAGVRTLSECMESVDTEVGRQRTRAVLRERPYPHYEADSAGDGTVVRVDEDGTRTAGRFVNREFQPADPGATGS